MPAFFSGMTWLIFLLYTAVNILLSKKKFNKNPSLWEIKQVWYFKFNQCYVHLTLWNLGCLEFKFDDTRVSYWHKNKIGRIENFFLLLPDFANFLPCWIAQFCWDSQQGRELAKSGSNKKKFNSTDLILMLIGKSGIIKFEFQTT